MAKDVDGGLRRLNLGIAFMLAASATSGYNASQINSLLVLPECESPAVKLIWSAVANQCREKKLRFS